jgi:hypothetical protein
MESSFSVLEVLASLDSSLARLCRSLQSVRDELAGIDEWSLSSAPWPAGQILPSARIPASPGGGGAEELFNSDDDDDLSSVKQVSGVLDLTGDGGDDNRELR